MAKRKKKPQPIEQTVWECGVEVSARQNDRGSDAMWRKGNISAEELIEMVQAHVGDRRSPRARRQDNLDRLLAQSVITKRQFDAGQDFQRDFYLGQLSGYPSPNYERTSRATDGGGNDRVDAARQRIDAVIKAMGGRGSPVTSAAWSFIGLQLTIKTVAGASGYRQEMHRKNILKALEIIADYYSPHRRKKTVDDHREFSVGF